MAINYGGAATGRTGSGAAGTGGAGLKGGSGNAAPTKTPVEYRDLTIATWNAQTLYSGIT